VLARVVRLMIEACMRQLAHIRPGTVARMAADEAGGSLRTSTRPTLDSSSSSSSARLYEHSL